MTTGNGTAMNVILSADQEYVLESVLAWAKTPSQVLTFGGLAGTGKTTLIKQICAYMPQAAVVAFTGKAVSVLRRKGVRNAQTLHSLCYQIKGHNEDGDPVFKRKLAIEPSLVIVDEASMINRTMHQDLESLASKILYVGDHGQLEPIGYDPGLMHDPHVKLEQIHRQAEGSAILRFAHYIREGGDPMTWDASQAHEVTLATRWPSDIAQYDAVLCGYNGTRHYLNKVIRKARGYDGILPLPGESLICLQNNRDMGLFNGMQVIVVEVEQVSDTGAHLTFKNDMDEQWSVPLYLPQLGTSDKFSREDEVRENFGLFDWGYALTCHKAQGSEWDRVCVVEQLHGNWALQRWGYTAATRAAKLLTYVRENRR